MSREIIEAVQTIEREKGIDEGTLVTALEDLERIEEETGERQHTLISDDDLDIDWEQVPEELIQREDVKPEDFGRIAAQTAKQVILQRIREAERAMMYDEYIDRVTEVVTGIVQQAGDRNNVLVDLGKVESLLPRSEQVDGERYEQGSRIKAVITEVRSGTKGPQVILSRRDPELIKTLFELEVPEIADGLVEIRGVAREPGYRSKIAVESHAQGVDPVGACVGPRGSRVRMVVSELRGEKIDIIPFNEEPARFVAKALSPARVREVLVDDDAKQATVIVPDDQLSLAIGKDGLNARLAARLTGWRVDIRSETEFAEEESEMGYAEEDVSGRCACILANGKRCPNASLPGSRYCGLPAHQALEGTGTDYLVPPEEGGGEEGGGEDTGDAEAPDDGELAASGNGEVPAAELAGDARVDEAAIEEAPVEEAAAEDVPVEDAPVEDAAAGDQPLDEEPLDEAEPVGGGEPAEGEGEVAVAEEEPLAGDEPPADEPEDDPAEEEAVASAVEETPAEEAEES